MLFLTRQRVKKRSVRNRLPGCLDDIQCVGGTIKKKKHY